MTFNARYPGRCPNCELRIEVGDPVDYEDDVVVHAGCENRTAVTKTPEPCPRCWMTLAANGSCACED